MNTYIQFIHNANPGDVYTSPKFFIHNVKETLYSKSSSVQLYKNDVQYGNSSTTRIGRLDNNYTQDDEIWQLKCEYTNADFPIHVCKFEIEDTLRLVVFSQDSISRGFSAYKPDFACGQIVDFGYYNLLSRAEMLPILQSAKRRAGYISVFDDISDIGIVDGGYFSSGVVVDTLFIDDYVFALAVVNKEGELFLINPQDVNSVGSVSEDEYKLLQALYGIRYFGQVISSSSTNGFPFDYCGQPHQPSDNNRYKLSLTFEIRCLGNDEVIVRDVDFYDSQLDVDSFNVDAFAYSLLRKPIFIMKEIQIMLVDVSLTYTKTIKPG